MAEQKGSHSMENAPTQEIQPEHEGSERQETSASYLYSLCRIWQAWFRKNYVKDVQLT